MRKLTIIAMLLGLAGLLMAAAVFAEEATHDYVGAKKCKACHKAIYTAWSETGHATAFDVLTDEEKKNDACVACHTTGVLAKDSSLMEGVQCEACHGAGSDFKSAKIMSKKKWAADPEAHKAMAIEAGLIYPTAENCVVCHTEKGNKNFKEFKFEDRVKAVHTVKEVAAEKAATE